MDCYINKQSRYEIWLEQAREASKRNPEYFRVLEKHSLNLRNYPEIKADRLDLEQD